VDLERWNAASLTFTYTILDPSESRCLGCVYILPRARRSSAAASSTPQPKARGRGRTWTRTTVAGFAGGRWTQGWMRPGWTKWTNIDAAGCHWVGRRGMDAGMDATVRSELGEWSRLDTGFDRIVFVTNDQFGGQTDLFQRFGFGREFKNRQPDAEGTRFGCGPQ